VAAFLSSMARGLAMGGGEASLMKGGASLQKGMAVQQSATQSLAKSSEKAGQATKSFSDRLREFQNSALQAQAQAYLLKSYIEGLSGAMVGQVTAVASFLKSIVDPIASLTKLSNPAAVEQLTLAFNDALAVIGRGMLPIVQAFTRAIRVVGDNYARLEPLITSVSNAVARGMDRVFSKLAKIWEQNGPAAELMASALEMVIDGVTELALQFLNLTKWLTKAWNAIAKLFGFTGSSTKPGASSFGAAVRDVRFESSAEKISQDATLKAFQQVLNAGKPTQEDVPNLLDKIGSILETKLDEIKEFLSKFPTAKDIEQAIQNLINALINAVSGKAGGIAGGVVSGIAGGGAAGKLTGLLASLLTR